MFNEEEGEFDELDEREFYASEIDWDPVGDEEYEEEILFGEYPRCQMICSIGCEHWGGDGLCMLELEEMAAQDRYYRHQKWYEFYGWCQRVFYRTRDLFVTLWLKIFHQEQIKTMDDLPF
jgi:hypothetical protein